MLTYTEHIKNAKYCAWYSMCITQVISINIVRADIILHIVQMKELSRLCCWGEVGVSTQTQVCLFVYDRRKGYEIEKLMGISHP